MQSTINAATWRSTQQKAIKSEKWLFLDFPPKISAIFARRSLKSLEIYRNCVNGSQPSANMIHPAAVFHLQPRVMMILAAESHSLKKEGSADVTSVNQFIALSGRFNDLCTTWKKHCVYTHNRKKNYREKKLSGEAKFHPLEGTWHRLTRRRWRLIRLRIAGW